MEIVDSAAAESTTSVSSMNVEPNTSSNMSASMNVENSMAEPVAESTSSAPEATTTGKVLENTISTGKVDSVAESPAAKGRSPKQKEADEGAAKILERMRNLYNVEFADIPANKRPKPPSWAARAALYKNDKEREEYISEMVQNARNSLSMKGNAANVSSTGNNADTLFGRLMQEVNTARTALNTVAKVAQQLKNVTRKGKRTSAANNSGMSAATNDSMNNSMGMANNLPSYNSSMNNNMENSNANFMKPKRVSPLASRKTPRTKTKSRSRSQLPMTPMTF
jgi:hypothetical protein